MTQVRSRLARAALVLVLGFFVAGAIAAWFVRSTLTGSLPALDGEQPLAGLRQPVSVDRDDLGIPTIAAASRADAARALGFLHAQDRFFQMDLQRRQPAGELAALVGARALPADRAMRVHRFRAIAREALARMPTAYRTVLDAYAEGVNGGLAALAHPPFEYLLLGQAPAAWRAEDSILTLLAMFNTLQGRQAPFERTIGEIRDVLPAPLASFLTARGSDWDAPVVGISSPRPPIPSADVFDLRSYLASHRREAATRRARADRTGGAQDREPAFWRMLLSPDEAAGLGSNSWVVGGAHTASGAALVANDMHLTINVPNIWYRAVMRVPDPIERGRTLQLAGVTLPGLPNLVVGSNGFVAWGFTNAAGDWSDLVAIERDARDPAKYVTPDGPRAFDDFDETIEVADGTPETLRVRWTIWGPLVGTDIERRPLAQRWVAHDPEVLASDTLKPETARTTADALERFAGLGIPSQNVVVGDREGHIGWTIAGPIPRRRGHDGLTPTSWADGSRGWDGYLPAAEFPQIVDPPSGRIWTANAPVADDARIETIGDGGYADGIRARMIRDRLLAISRATPADMLAVQLEDGALFHERWRTLLLDTLTERALAADPRRAEFKRLLERSWTGRASPDSVGYRLVRTVRQILNRDALAALAAPVEAVDPDFDVTRAQRSEGPLWALVTARPLHLLDPRFTSWEEQILAAIDAAIADPGDDVPLAERTWGLVNRAQVRHPLAGALPFVSRWLDMPDDPLPGDIYTPRAHSPRTGPSERMVVSPGREEEGIAHMPAGQSGHPLSPHYRDEHRAWVEGTPLPFLPGPARHALRLVPAPHTQPDRAP